MPACVRWEMFMAASQEHVSDATPMGARLVADGATFRVWLWSVSNLRRRLERML